MNGSDPCEHCGEDKKQHGTSVDLEVFYADYKYAGYPAFCSWEHAAAWFNQPRPDFTTWDKSADRKQSLGDRAVSATLVLTVLVIVALGVVGLLVVT